MEGATTSESRRDDPLTLLYRTGGYAVFSFLALFSNPWNFSNLRFPIVTTLLFAFFISLGFFAAYSAIFHPTRRHFPIPPIELKLERKDFKFFTIIGVGVAAGCAYHLWSVPERVPIPLLLALLSYSLATLSYGIFLLWKYPTYENPPIRYQLIFPILLSITLPLYIGLNLSHFTSYVALLPFVFLTVYFFVATTIKRRLWLTVWSSSCVGGMCWFSNIFPWAQPHVNSFLFATAVSAYAAVFESWNVTNRAAHLSSTWDSLSERNYYASFAALVFSVFSAAILFVFTSRSSLLLMFLAIHSTVSLFVWYTAAPPSKLLVDSDKWWLIKLFLGLCIFAGLIFDDKIGNRTLKTSLGIESVSITVFLSILNFLGFLRISDQPILTVPGMVEYYNRDKRNLLRHMFIVIIIGLGVFFNLYSNRGTILNEEMVKRAGNGFYLFMLYCTLTIISLGLTNRPPDTHNRLQITLHRIMGIAISMRLFSSICVGLSVFLTAWHRGDHPKHAFWVGLPFSLAAMGGFCLNDFLDIEKDRQNRPYRALPRGIIQPLTILSLSILLLLVATITIFFVAESKFDYLIYFSVVGGLAAYNVVLRISAGFKTIYTGLISCLPFVLVIFKYQYPHEFWIFPLSVLFFVSGRELWMDVYDIEGDRQYGLRTLPVLVGENITSTLGALCLAVGSLSLLLLSTIRGDWLGQLVAILLTISCAGLIVLWRKRRVWAQQIIYGCWIPMAFGLLLLIRA